MKMNSIQCYPTEGWFVQSKIVQITYFAMSRSRVCMVSSFEHIAATLFHSTDDSRLTIGLPSDNGICIRILMMGYARLMILFELLT